MAGAATSARAAVAALRAALLHGEPAMTAAEAGAALLAAVAVDAAAWYGPAAPAPASPRRRAGAKGLRAPRRPPARDISSLF